MTLSNFILGNLESILHEWEEFAASLVPPSQKMDQVMLRDHARQVLETIAADLVRPETALEKSEKSKGRGASAAEKSGGGKSAAMTHGANRVESGFSLNATVSEYRALRASVTRLWEEAHIGRRAPKMVIDDLIRFNEAIDQAVSESVESYYIDKEQQTRVFNTILSSSPDLSCTFDLECRFAYANKALSELLDLPLEKIVGKKCGQLDMPSAADLQHQIQFVIRAKEKFRGEISYMSAAGQAEFYEYIFVPVLDKDGAVEAVAGTARNVTERKAAEDKNWNKANFDGLTGLPNRLLFRDRLEQDIKHAARTGAPIGLMFIDLDNFKEANDLFGHQAGDHVLQLAAERIRSCVRDTDTVARLGGDEFTVILLDLLSGRQVRFVAEKILKELASPFQLSSNTLRISASIGISLYPQEGRTAEHLLQNADDAMYAAKKAGRNCIRFYAPDQGECDFSLQPGP